MNHREHVRNGIPHIPHGQVGEGDVGPGGQRLGQPEKARGIRFIRGIPHGHQWGLKQAQAILQHVAGAGGFGPADKAPANAGAAEGGKKGLIHQQGLLADEAGPPPRLTAHGAPVVPPEIQPGEHLHHRCP